ncbi:MAG: hypothetical protein IPJ37_21080 [Bacteroidales bacterium]|nr:hypothetical protein [Bacteroidales bacterium]
MISTLDTFLENFAEIEPFCAGLKKISYEQKKFILIFSSLFDFHYSDLISGSVYRKDIGSEFNRGMELFNKEKYPGPSVSSIPM